MKNILIIGAGGHSRSVVDTLNYIGEYNNIGIVDKKDTGHPLFVGTDHDLKRLRNDFQFAFLAVTNKPYEWKKRYFENLNKLGFKIPNIIDRTCIKSDQIFLECGIFAGKNTVINTNVKISRGAIINSSCVLEHDVSIGEYSNIAPGSVLLGGVKVGDNTLIGANSTIRENVQIGSNVIVGMGSNVIRGLIDEKTYLGNPAKEITK